MYPELLVPTNERVPGAVLKQEQRCLDSMGHVLDGNVGIYLCHSSGGNQVSETHNYSFSLYKTLKRKLNLKIP